MKRKLTCIFLLLCFCSAAHAENYAQLHLGSLHAKSDVDVSGNNPGLGYLYRGGKLVIAAGAYRNSVREISKYGVAGYLPFQYKELHVGGVAGIVNGYPGYNSGRFAPFAAGVALIDINERLSLITTVIPPLKNVTPATLSISFGVKF